MRNAELKELQWLNKAREACAKHYLIVANPELYEYDCIVVANRESLDSAIADCARRKLIIVKICDVAQPSNRKPKIGDEIYIRGAMYIDHGEDDYDGGRATISAVTIGISAGKPTWFIEVEEVPGHQLNYDILMEEQDKLKKEYGRRKAKPNPDYGQ